MNLLTRRLRSLLYRSALMAAGRQPARKSRHFRLAVLKLDRLGDATLALGAIRRLTGEFGESQTLLMVSPVAAPLMRAEFPQATLLILPAFCERYWPDFIRFLQLYGAELRGLAVDHFVCLRHQPSDYLHAIAHLVSPQRCIAAEWLQPWSSVALAFPRVEQVPYPGDADAGASANRELEAHRRVAACALESPVAADDVLPALESVASVEGDVLLVCPAAGDPLREYPPPLLAEALRIFLEDQSLPVEICLPPERDPQPWQQALAQAGVSCQAWHRPAALPDLLRLLATARIVVAPESAPAHLATTLDKPGVFLLGGGHIGLLAPWRKSAHQIWLQHPVECYHCRWNCSQPEPFCITRIKPAEVAQALQQALRIG